MSRPVSTNTTSLRNPPIVAIPTFSVGGGGSPRTPLMPHAIRTVVGEDDRVEAGRDVRSGVARPGDLVEQLGGDGLGGHCPPGAGVLGDHARPVGVDLGDRKAGPPEVVDLGEEGVVAAGRLGAALDDVAGDRGTGEGVEVGATPSEVRRRRTDDERSVGDAAGDDDVGAAFETGDDAPGAEVGVGA